MPSVISISNNSCQLSEIDDGEITLGFVCLSIGSPGWQFFMFEM